MSFINGRPANTVMGMVLKKIQPGPVKQCRFIASPQNGTHRRQRFGNINQFPLGKVVGQFQRNHRRMGSPQKTIKARLDQGKSHLSFMNRQF